MNRKHRRIGFTLVELMIVVGMIGLLSAIAIPAYMRARRTAHVTRIGNDLRVFGESFTRYSVDFGLYPVDTHIVLPPKMGEYIRDVNWDTPCLGGNYNWEGPTWGEGGGYPYAGISLFGVTDVAKLELEELDQVIDDGDLSTGMFRREFDRYTFIVEE